MNKIIATSILLFFSLLTSQAHSADPLGGGGNDFLPVEEAYKVSFDVKEDNLKAIWSIADGYYLYRSKFLLEAQVNDQKSTLATAFETGKVHFDEYLGEEVEIYYGSTELNTSIASLPQQFVLKVKSQGCADAGLCYAPRTQYFNIDRRFGTAIETDKASLVAATRLSANTVASEESSLSSTPIAKKTRFAAYWVYILFAIGGGLILNLMPCVFPVLSLKALTFAASSGSPHTHHLHGWAYTAGVIGSFSAAAVMILIAKAAGEQTGWGFQLQYPPFVAAITYLFFLMGLSLSGLIYFGTGLMGLGQGLTTKEGYRGSFFTGVLAALVASPCTGPMMAPALGFALTQPPIGAIAIFISLGFGMALPFLLLSYSPKLARMLPRPGMWMEKLKELLAFPMYITAAWLLFVFGRQVGMLGAFYLMIGAIGLVFAIWLFQNLPDGRKFRLFVRTMGIASILFAGHTVVNSEQFRKDQLQDPWLTFSKELVHKLRSEGQPVFVDFTADWCITCKANEKIALSREGFWAAVKQNNVALVKGDWTNEDPRISEILAEFDRSGVPLYLVYSADMDEEPIVLPQLLSQDMVVAAINQAANGSTLAILPPK